MTIKEFYDYMKTNTYMYGYYYIPNYHKYLDIIDIIQHKGLVDFVFTRNYVRCKVLKEYSNEYEMPALVSYKIPEYKKDGTYDCVVSMFRQFYNRHQIRDAIKISLEMIDKIIEDALPAKERDSIKQQIIKNKFIKRK